MICANQLQLSNLGKYGATALTSPISYLSLRMGGHGVWRGSQLLYHGTDFAEFHPIALKELLWDFFWKSSWLFLSGFSCLFRFGFSVICLIVVWFCQILNWSRCYRALSSCTPGSRLKKWEGGLHRLELDAVLADDVDVDLVDISSRTWLSCWPAPPPRLPTTGQLIFPRVHRLGTIRPVNTPDESYPLCGICQTLTNPVYSLKFVQSQRLLF